MNSWLITLVQIHNFMIAPVSGGMCPETLQECFNCKAAATCAPYRDIKREVSKDDCIALLENAGNIMVEYEAGPGICKAFNCQYREEAQGYSTMMISCRSDCPQYIIESRIQQSGSCFIKSRFATSGGDACLQFCLHHDGCMGVTHQVYPNEVHICTFHTCSSSVFETMYNSTFTGINCTTIPGLTTDSTSIPTTYTQPLTTGLQGNRTTVQNPVTSSATFNMNKSITVLPQKISTRVSFSSPEWRSMPLSSDLHHLSTTTRISDTTANTEPVLVTTISFWALSLVISRAVTAFVSYC